MLRHAIIPEGSWLMQIHHATPGLDLFALILARVMDLWDLCSAKDSPCCGPKDICLSNGLCFSILNQGVVRGVRFFLSLVSQPERCVHSS
jgi:hypothetical protein